MERRLTRSEMISAVEGRGAPYRVPMTYHAWVNPGVMRAGERACREILDKFPCDIEKIYLSVPDTYKAPPDDPSYRWTHQGVKEAAGTGALDSAVAMPDWSELSSMLADFPNPNYHGLIPKDLPPRSETYRVALWWYWLFERLWSLRGMQNALVDYYDYPDEVHALYRALTDFYKGIVLRAKRELNCDAVWTSDDIGMQTGPFFSLDLFREFFKPYYKELIDFTHEQGMHFWLHACGDILTFLPDLIEMGLDVIHPIQKYAMSEIQTVDKFGGQIAFWAGFDVQRTIPYGTPEDVRREVRFMLDTYYRKDGGLILTAGNNMTPDTPMASLEALLDETIRYSKEIRRH